MKSGRERKARRRERQIIRRGREVSARVVEEARVERQKYWNRDNEIWAQWLLEASQAQNLAPRHVGDSGSASSGDVA